MSYYFTANDKNDNQLHWTDEGWLSNTHEPKYYDTSAEAMKDQPKKPGDAWACYLEEIDENGHNTICAI